jgi:hypothetical protein
VNETLLAPPVETTTQSEEVPLSLKFSPRWLKESWRDHIESSGLLYLVLLIQTGLTVALSNTAFNDEATYIMVGHAEIAHILHSAAIPNYDKTISGAPFIYPPIAAVVNDVGGLGLVRVLSLIFMLLATSLVFAITRRLFDRSAAVLAAATFAVCAPILFMGHLGTYDAMAVFLLALAFWLAVIGTERLGWRVLPYEIGAGLVGALAGATKYTGLLYLVPIAATAFLVDLRTRRNWTSLARTLAPFVVGAGSLLVGFWTLAHGLVAGFRSTTINPVHVYSAFLTIVGDTSLYIGAMLLLGLVGFVFVARRGAKIDILMAIILLLSGLLAPVWQYHIHTYVSLQKHSGYGLLFVAPMVGVALSSALKRWRRRVVIPLIAVLVALVSIGANTSQSLFSAWPNTSNLLKLIQPRVHFGHSLYLVEEGIVPEYYFSDVTFHRQWISTYGFTYRENDGQTLVGTAAFEAGIEHSTFDLVALSNGPTKTLDVTLEHILKTSDHYRLIGKLHYDTSFGPGLWRVWQRT